MAYFLQQLVNGVTLGAVYGLIAKSIETPADRSWAIFELRPEARFHDGKPITDINGAVLAWSTPGTVGFKGSKKSTPYAAQLATERLLTKAKDFGIRSVQVMVKGTGSGRNAVINALKNSGLRVEDVKNVTPMAHG